MTTVGLNCHTKNQIFSFPRSLIEEYDNFTEKVEEGVEHGEMEQINLIIILFPRLVVKKNSEHECPDRT